MRNQDAMEKVCARRIAGHDSMKRSAASIIATVAGLTSIASAADRQWNGSTADWAATTNWQTSGGSAANSAPGSTTGTTNVDTAYFRSVTFGTVTPDANRNIKNITFSGSSVAAFTIGTTSGNSLLLTSGGTIANQISKASTNETINAPLIIEAESATADGSYTIRNDSTGGSGDGLLITGTLQGGATTGNINLALTGSNAAASSQLSGVISNGSAASLGVTVSSGTAATWALIKANTYTGATTISGGVLSTSTGGTLADGGIASAIGQSSSAAGNLVLDGGTLKDGNTNAVLSTNRLFTLTSNGGTIDSTGNYITRLSFTNNGALAYVGTGVRTLTLTGTATTANTFTPLIADSDASNSTGLTKSGVGTWVLNNVNSYTGTTTITGGTLSLASGASISGSKNILVGDTSANGSAVFNVSAVGGYHVSSGQALGGYGTIIGDATIDTGAAAGGGVSSGIGKLAVSGNLAINGVVKAKLDLSGNGVANTGAINAGMNDVLAVSGSVTIGTDASLNLSALNGVASDTPSTYVLLDHSGTSLISGSFLASHITLPQGMQYTLNYSYDADGDGANNDLAVTVSAVPEPATLALFVLAGGVLVRRRRASFIS